METPPSKASRFRPLLVHVGYLAVFFPIFSVFTQTGLRTLGPGVEAGLAFVGANLFVAALQWWLRKTEASTPTSPLSLLIHNAAFFTERLFNLAAAAWFVFLVVTIGFALFMYQFLFFWLCIVWFVGVSVVLIYTARTKKIYAQEDPLQVAQVKGIFWPYILVFIVAILAGFLSLPGVQQALHYQSARVTGEVPAESVSATYISENADYCDFYEKMPFGNQYELCKLRYYENKQIYTSDPIDCSIMSEDYPLLIESCTHLQTVQTAIQTRNSDSCSLVEGTLHYPLCIGQFPQTKVWEKGCAVITRQVMVEGKPADALVGGRCLTGANANLVLPRSTMGYGQCGEWKHTEAGYDRVCERLDAAGNYSMPPAPVWFTSSGILSERDVAYLTGIGVNPNATDAFGRTMLVIFMRNMWQLDSGIEFLPAEQLPAIVERELEPLKRLLNLGVDPNIEDATERNAFEHAQEIENEVLRARILELLEQGA